MAYILLIAVIILGMMLLKAKGEIKEKNDEIDRLKSELDRYREKSGMTAAPYEAPPTAPMPPKYGMTGAPDYSRMYRPAPTQPAPVQNMAAPVSQAQPAPMQPVPPHPAPMQPVPVQNMAAPASQAQSVPPHPAPTQPVPVQNMTASVSQAQSVPMQSVPVLPAPMQETPRTYGQDTAPVREKHNPVNIILGLGTLFVILAGFIFAVAAWTSMSEAGRVITLMLFSGAFFFLHGVAEKKSDLPQAGKVFYVIGSGTLAASVFAMGTDVLLSLSVMAFIAAVCSFAAAVHYESGGIAKAGYVFTTLSASAMSFFISEMWGTAILALIALILIFAEKKVKDADAGRFFPLTEEFGFFVTENIYVSALASLVLSTSAPFIVPVVIFSAAFLTSALKGEHTAANVSVFCGYFALGAFMSMKPSGADNVILLSVLVVTVYTVLSLITSIPETVRRLVNIVRVIGASLVIIGGVVIALRAEFDVTLALTSAVMTAELLISLLLRKDRGSLYALAPSFVFTAQVFSRLLPEGYRPLIVFAFLFGLVIIRLWDKVHHPSGEAVLCLAALFEVRSLADPFRILKGEEMFISPLWVRMTVCAVFVLMVFICSRQKGEHRITAGIFRYVLPVSLFLPWIMLPSDIREVTGVLLCFAAAMASLAKKEYIKPFALMWIVPMAASFGSEHAFMVPVCLAVYFTALSLLDKRNVRTMPFGGIADGTVCVYLSLMTMYQTAAGKSVPLWVIWGCLVLCAVVSYEKVSRWAVPASLIMAFCPLVITADETSPVFPVYMVLYGIAAAVTVRFGRSGRRARSFVYLLPLMFFTLWVMQSADFAPAIAAAAVIVLLMRPEEKCRIILEAVIIFGYILSLCAALSPFITAAVWLVMCAVFAVEKQKSRLVLPAAVISGILCLWEIPLFTNCRHIAAVILTAAYVGTALAKRKDSGLRLSFGICSPLLLIPSFVLSVSAERTWTWIAAAAGAVLVLAARKGEERKPWRTCLLTVLMWTCLIMSAHDAASLTMNVICISAVFVIWLMFTAAQVWEESRRDSLHQSVNTLITVIGAAVPMFVVSLHIFDGDVLPVITGTVAAAAVFRLICAVRPLISDRVSAWITPAGMAAVLISCSIGKPVYAALLILVSSAADAVKWGRKGSRRGLFLLFGTFIECVFVLSGADVTDVCCIAVSAAAAVIFLPSLITKKLIGRASKAFSQYLLPVMSSLIFIIYSGSGSTAVLACGGVLTVLAVINAVSCKNTMPMAAVLVIMFGCLSSLPVYAYAAVMAAAAAAGRVISAKLIDGKRSDTVSMSVLIGAAAVICRGINEGDRIISWIGIVLLAAAFLNLYRRGDSLPVRHTVLTAACLTVMPILWAQPFFTMPDIIKTEMILLPIAAALAGLYLIHADHRHIIGDISFPAAILMLVILLIDAGRTGLAFDAVFLGVMIIGVLSLSFLFRRKRWFVLAIAAAASEAVLMTFKLWRSQAWWIYLLAAGLILIGWGLSAEARRRDPDSKSALRAKLDEWKW